MADATAIYPTHPLFRLIWSYAFSQPEQMALRGITGVATTKKDRQNAADAAADSGWLEALEAILVADTQRELILDMPLINAARVGSAACIRLIMLKQTGESLDKWYSRAKDMIKLYQEGAAYEITRLAGFGHGTINNALAAAAYSGNTDATTEMIRAGAMDLDAAMAAAAEAGHITVIQLLIDKGATNYLRAYKAAARAKHDDVRRFLMIAREVQRVKGLRNR
jgi:hypothetical protein